VRVRCDGRTWCGSAVVRWCGGAEVQWSSGAGEESEDETNRARSHQRRGDLLPTLRRAPRQSPVNAWTVNRPFISLLDGGPNKLTFVCLTITAVGACLSAAS
jgi:hypothetical protein